VTVQNPEEPNPPLLEDPGGGLDDGGGNQKDDPGNPEDEELPPDGISA